MQVLRFISDLKRQFFCNMPSCNAEFFHEETLSFHLKNYNHALNLPLPCSDCNEKFANRRQLGMHRRDAHNKGLNCPVENCSYLAANEEYLEIHTRHTHRKERNFKV